MGRGIAQVCAAAGFQVLLYDVKEGAAAAAVRSVAHDLEKLVGKGKMTPDQKADIIRAISPLQDFEKLKADLIIEAAVEKLDVKQEIFRRLEAINTPESIFTTNTSSIPVTQIASVLQYPGRFAGLHFFNPAPVMKLVEVIQGAATSEATVELLVAVVKKLSKQAVLAQDSPGFIVNRVARHFYVEALKIAEEGVADFQSIDRLMKSAGFRMGPFELMDLIGVDVNFAVTSSLYNAFHQDPKFRPSRIQQKKVDAGYLGRKTGRGFYEY